MATNEVDVRHDDLEYDPTIEPKKAKAWLNLLQESEDAFEEWNDHCDRIDKQFANLSRLANMSRDKEFQMFWSNAEVLKPSIYAKAPIPVVVPKFLDRRPVYQAAAEVMERCCTVAFDLCGINELMMLVRDDLALIDRGVAWCRYESGDRNKAESVEIDFKARRDFLHSISRNWREVSWVAGASYLTRAEARDRFYKTSGDEYQRADYKVDKESKEVGGSDSRERAKFWEIWDKANKRVIWVSEGCEFILDEDDPHLDLRQYFPCPKPAYGTCQRYSLVPVPDVLQYKDQLDEINELTGKIHALSQAVVARGFYPAGGGEIADAVQAAIAVNTPGQVLVPVSNWASFGGSKEVIIWLPIDMIAQTITGLVALRKQIIDDIYQIMGLSDIMRGSTNPQETLGAQQLKSEYGSTRIQDKQQELVRLARDLVEITSEIITEKFDDSTIIEMSQTQLPTQTMVKQKAIQLQMGLRTQQDQVQAMGQNPQAQQMAQQNPDQANQIAQQSQLQITQGMEALQKLQTQPTIEQVLHFLKDNRAKAFVLDIETDSTIIADEGAEKQARNEFVGVLAQILPQLAQMIMAEPQTAEFCGEVLKFATAPYRAGRSMDGAIDSLVQLMDQKGNQPKGDDPTTMQNKTALQIEQLKVNAQQQTDAAKLQLQAQELQMKDRHKAMELDNQRNIALANLQAKQGDNASKVQIQNQKAMESREAHQAEMLGKIQEMHMQREKANQQFQQSQQRADDQRQRAALLSQQAAQRQQRPI
jgi:hypothetical protein